MTKKFLVFLEAIVFLVACTPQTRSTDITVNIIADGISQQVTLVSGSTVQQALNTADITLSQTDRVDPPAYTTLQGGITVTVTRMREEFETRQVIIPYERQELHNESLPAGETRLVQAGQNGLAGDEHGAVCQREDAMDIEVLLDQRP